jgi:hypothetical protein
MKKQLFLFLMTVSMSIGYAQESRSNFPEPSQHTSKLLYANDQTVYNSPNVNQRRARLSVAFNGWLYSACLIDSANSNGIVIRRSKDNGYTWITIDQYLLPKTSSIYPTFDLIVTGTDTNNLKLFLLGVNRSSGVETIYLDRYDARTGAFLGNTYLQNIAPAQVMDLAIASDYILPALGASPYSVAFVYSVRGSATDSLVGIVSVDGGQTFTGKNKIISTLNYLRNVSLAYGRSQSGSNGRYFTAFESLSSSSIDVGNIYTAHNQSTVSGGWTTPKNIDSVSSSTIGKCKNPSISCSIGTIDNDSNGVSTLVLVDRLYAPGDWDVLGFYNKRAHSTNFWKRLDVNNSNNNNKNNHISYDPALNNFLVTYFDSTNGKIPYVVKNFNLATPNIWSLINSQYNDVTTNLVSPFPRVHINPVYTQTAHVWTAEGAGNNGITMFDAEYNALSLSQLTNLNFKHSVSPNPASTFFNIKFDLQKASQNMSLKIYNILGQVILNKNMTKLGLGLHTKTIDATEWEKGTYIYELSEGNISVKGKISIFH